MNLKKIFPLIKKILLAYLLFILSFGIIYIIIPPVSTLMAARLLTFRGIDYDIVNIEKVSPQLIRSVIRAEDAKFCQHSGIDWDSLFLAIKNKDGRSRGASTISMQVAKNLFLWPQQSYIRKAIEIPVAIYIDIIWSKKRMMEVYLSIAEWGDGVFGVEAASQKYFKKPAKNLNSYESALLAAMLPSPLKRNPNNPRPYYIKYANNLQKWANSSVDISCVKKGK